MVLYPFLSVCSWNPFGPGHWDLDCVARFLAITIGIPLAIASVVGFFKKSKDIFWNTLAGGLLVMATCIVIDASI